MDARAKLVFAVNGERFELSEVDPSITLLEFLRTQTRFKGPKLGCGEGGCGACVVLLSTYDIVNDQVNECSVSSCLTLLCSIDFCSVTTSEGLGNIKNGFHSIHKRFAGFHASQCGFCTPGMCMSLFSALVNAEKSNRPEAPAGFSSLTGADTEKSIAGNLCRCTGYRPIVDACKSFAADIDLEDLGLNVFWKKGEQDATVDKLPYYNPETVCTFPEFLKTEIKSSIVRSNNSIISDLPHSYWLRPNSVDELHHLLSFDKFSDAKMVVGNTGAGVYKENDLYHKYIDLKRLPELSTIRREAEGITFGAAVTISRAIEVLKAHQGNTPPSGTLVFIKIADHMNRIASPFVRNMASLGGNIIMAQRNQFASDLATILLAAGTTVCLRTLSESLVLSLEEFLDSPPCDNQTLLINIRIPCWSPVSKTSYTTNEFDDFASKGDPSIRFETYRAAPRPLGNAVAYLNAAFLGQVSVDENSGDLVFDNLQLAFGAYGGEHAIRVRKVEKFLEGRVLTPSIIVEAMTLLKDVIIPKEGTLHSGFRKSLAVSFLFQFLQPLVKELIEHGKTVDIGIPKTAEISEYHAVNGDGCVGIPYNKAAGYHQLQEMDSIGCILSSSKQEFQISTDYLPVGDPIKKAGAELQASGEAVYVDDIPSPKDCLYGAFVYSTSPLAHVKSIKFNSSSASQKIIAQITVNDIPKGGQNIGCSTDLGSETLFAGSLTEYAGQPLAVVVARTQRWANMAAKQAIVTYTTEDLEPPILSVEDAVKRSSYFPIPPMFSPEDVGDLSKGMAEADHKILSAEVRLGSQYYFYMETQTALAIPDEDNCIVVYTSSQLPETTQNVIAKCLGLPVHNVRVITRRVGGGFGGKALKSVPIATACAVAAFKLRRPVRMYLDRKTDMIMAGGRHPMKIKYSVGFKTDGKITALHLNILINAGISEDISPAIPFTITGTVRKYNWGALSFDIKICKTNVSSKSAMRAPGDLQGAYIAEVVIEHVASFLSMDPHAVRRKNLHTYDSLVLFYGRAAGESPVYTLPSIVDKLVYSSNYLSRLELIQHFNSRNKWKKRGISCVPVIYKVTIRPTPGKVSILGDGSIVVEVGGIEIGQGLWTKVKQVTAFALGKLCHDQSQNLLERIRVIQADSLSLIQGGWTAGSTTSESSCEAVRLSCNVLVDRLKSLKESLENEMGSVTWDILVMQANMRAVNLSASVYWVPDSTSVDYLNYGAAISEVEINVLTGATSILRTDITYDCGQSLNPAVDLGQIEGAFAQGIGFFMYEEYLTNSDGLVVTEGTWTYKIPTIDTIPKEFNVELLNSGHHEKRVLSSKASGEPPLVLAASVHCAMRDAIRAARQEFSPSSGPDGLSSTFQLDVPATMPVVKELCGLNNVEKYLEMLASVNPPKLS